MVEAEEVLNSLIDKKFSKHPKHIDIDADDENSVSSISSQGS